jgi:hypothetical protein
MNAVAAAVLLAIVATCSATVYTTGYTGYGSQYYYPSAGVQYVAPTTNYGYGYAHQPVVSSSSVVAQSVPVSYASSAVVPTTYANTYSNAYSNAYGNVYGLHYPQAYGYNYGTYGYLKK